MFSKIKNIFKNRIVNFIILFFFLSNLFFLNNFPFIHSDEAWLSGLSREMMINQSLAVTESFFDLMPRFPHALKILFHLLQIIFIKIFSYRVFTFRLISLLAGSLSLYLFFKIAFLVTNSKKLSVYAVIFLGLDIHFIYSSHLARQEIILLFIFLSSFYYFLKYVESNKTTNYFNSTNDYIKENTTYSVKHDIFLALILGSAVGFHPNAFIISLPLIMVYSYNLFFNKNFKFKNYFAFGAVLAVTALFFVYLSFQLDPNFLNHYLNYGAKLGVSDNFLIKFNNFKNFYLKLFYRVSGTYYIPEIRFQFIFFAAVLFLSTFKLFFKKNKITLYLILSLFAINLAYFIVGRYNQTSIIFIFPTAYLLFINLIKNFNSQFKKILSISLILVLTFISANTIIKDSHYNYQNYLKQIASVVEDDRAVLANLNTAYYFKANNLYDYRNLAYLEDNNLSFKDYIIKNKIEYIIYPAEMDYIYNHRPSWNILYGNLYPYYSEMQNFMQQNTNLIKEFKNSTYAVRIVKEISQKKWSVKIYQVNSEVLTAVQ